MGLFGLFGDECLEFGVFVGGLRSYLLLFGTFSLCKRPSVGIIWIFVMFSHIKGHVLDYTLFEQVPLNVWKIGLSGSDIAVCEEMV